MASFCNVQFIWEVGCMRRVIEKITVAFFNAFSRKSIQYLSKKIVEFVYLHRRRIRARSEMNPVVLKY